MGGARFAPPFDLNIHLQDPQPGYFWLAERNVLIPNQECFQRISTQDLAGFSEVWAKTRLAEKMFLDRGCKTRFLGWTSFDHGASIEGNKERSGALHVAGSSIDKGTDAVLDVWERNPGWPRLRVVRRPVDYAGSVLPWRERESADNIEIITDRVDERTLRRLQNGSALYVCPSEAEGFGHVILEGMSVGAVVITTNAPPMNELVSPDAGLLVEVERSEAKGLGERYFVSHEDLERKVRRALEMSDAERAALGRAARVRYERLDQEFRARIKDALHPIFVESPCERGEPIVRMSEK